MRTCIEIKVPKGPKSLRSEFIELFGSVEAWKMPNIWRPSFELSNIQYYKFIFKLELKFKVVKA